MINIKTKQFLAACLIFGFLLGIQDGNIALWEDGKSDPIRVFPYSADNLPPADRAVLEKGIHLDNKLQLIRLIEDYLS